MRYIPLIILLFSVLSGCQPQYDTAADEKVLRDLDAKWSEAAQAQDVSTFASFFADDGIQIQPNMPPLIGRQAIEEATRRFFGPNVDLSFSPLEVVVSRSGDLAYVRGTYRLELITPDGTITDQGSSLVVWKKIDGTWKAAVDIFNSDITPSSP